MKDTKKNAGSVVRWFTALLSKLNKGLGKRFLLEVNGAMREYLTGFHFIIIVLICLVFALGIGLIWVSGRWRRRNRKRQRAAYAGETEALAMLKSAGFIIEGSQVRRSTGLWVNDEWMDIEVRVDFLATRRGRPCVIEVKTGELAPNPRHGPTRRQLLEYSLLFPEREIYLLDMSKGVAHRIEFPKHVDGS